MHKTLIEPEMSPIAKTTQDTDAVSVRPKVVSWGTGAGLFLVLLVAWVFSLGMGAISINPLVTIRVVLEGVFPGLYFTGLPDPGPIDHDVIWNMRLPRTAMAAICGAGLAICGLATQALLRNILADPYILGISSGASTGAALVMVLGVGMSLFPASPSIVIVFGAFLGSLTSVIVVFVLAGLSGPSSTTRVVFAGMAVNFFFSAVTSLLIMLAKNPSVTKGVMFWMLGSFNATRWHEVGVVSICVFVGCAWLFLHGRNIDAMTLGDDAARGLGLNPSRTRVSVFFVVSLIVAALVSVSGTIGFVGLVVPHIAKKMYGGIFRQSFLGCALIGAILMLGADLLSRLLVAPGELSVGIITALVGTPLLMSLIHRNAVTNE